MPTAANRATPASQAQAVCLEIPVTVHASRYTALVRGQAAASGQLTEDTKTVIVFPQGAVIRLAASVVPDELLTLINQRTDQQVLCRVVSVKAHPNVKSHVEVAFTQQAPRFWGVEFPPLSRMPADRKGGDGGTGLEAAFEVPVPSSVES